MNNSQRRPFIKVWPFSDAPPGLRKLCDQGGDEDWIAQVPAEMSDMYIDWMSPGTPFGKCDVVEYSHPLLKDVKVFVGVHA